MGIAQGLPPGLGEEGGFPKRKGQCAGLSSGKRCRRWASRQSDPGGYCE